MLQQNSLLAVYPATLTALLKMVNDQSIASSLSSRDAAIDADEIFSQDWEDQSVGASSSFSVLKSSTTAHTKADLTSFLVGKDVRVYLGQGLKELHGRQGAKVRRSFGCGEAVLHWLTYHPSLPFQDDINHQSSSSRCSSAISAIHDMKKP